MEKTWPRLLGFSIRGWEPLGTFAEVKCNRGITVLVGRNGVGKSALLEGFDAAAFEATTRFGRRRPEGPSQFEILLETPDGKKLKYSSTREEHESRQEDEDSVEAEVDFHWNDVCVDVTDIDEPVTLWESKSGVLDVPGMESTLLAEMATVVQVRPRDPEARIPVEVHWIRFLLRSVRLVIPAGTTRTVQRRREVLVRAVNNGRAFRTIGQMGGISRLAAGLARLSVPDWRGEAIEDDEDSPLKEFVAVCKRIGIVRNSVVIRHFRDAATPSSESEDKEWFASVEFDGVNIGLLSDGTIRVAHLISALVGGHSGETLLIEEPEACVHPGLVSKILAEIETYGVDRCVIVTTHSPQVVAEIDLPEIQFVHRDEEGNTFVSEIGEDDATELSEYLANEGDIGDWTFGQES